MAISLSKLTRKGNDKPPIIAIYGRGKMGKTTLASEFPSPFFMMTEEGTGLLEITTFENDNGDPTIMGDFKSVMDGLSELASQDHDFKTLVVDSVTQLEPVIWREVCDRNGWKSIEDPGYGKGYIECDAVWREFFAACKWLRDNKGMTIVMIGHEVVETFSDPEREDYSRYRMRLHKRAEAMIRELCDVVGFMNAVITIDKTKGGFGKETAKAKGSGQRALYLSPRPTFEAGNRYSMPSQVLLNPGEGYAAIAQYLPGQGNKSAAAAA